MEECVSSLMERRSWRSTHLLFVLHIWVLVLYHYCKLQVLMCLHFIHILSRFCFIEMVLFGMPVGLGLGRDHEPHYGRREGMVLMPYDPLWVGQLAGLRGRTVEPAAGPRGTRCMKGSIPLGGSPRLLSVARALLPKRVFYLEGGGRKPGQWERARARVRQTWGFHRCFITGGMK